MTALASIGSGLKKAASIVGFGAAIKVARKVRDGAMPDVAKAGAEILRDDIASATRNSARKETFAEACARLGVSPAELANTESRLARSALFWRLASAATLAVGVLSMVFTSDSVAWSLLYLTEGLAVAILFAVRAFRDSFRLWQVRRRDLAPVRQFVREGGLHAAFIGG